MVETSSRAGGSSLPVDGSIRSSPDPVAEVQDLVGRVDVAGPVATWVRAHVRGLRIGAVALAVLTFVFLTQPSGIAILLIAAVLLLVLAVIEFLGRPADEVPVAAGAEPG